MPIRLTNPMSKPNPISRIIGEYRWNLGLLGAPLTHRDFMAELNLSLATIKRVISPESIRCWEKGLTVPSDEDLNALTTCANPSSWQWHFAQDLKAAKYPWIHAPTCEIGIRILGREKPLKSDANQP